MYREVNDNVAYKDRVVGVGDKGGQTRSKASCASATLAFEYAKHQPPNNDNDVIHSAQFPDDGPYER